MPSPELDQIIAILRARPIPVDISIEQLRLGFEMSMGMLPVPDSVAREEITLAGRPAERLRAPGGDGSRAVLYLHGGAYCIGSIRTHRSLAARIALASGADVFLLDYRLAPEHPFPAAIEDAAAAYRAILAQGYAPAKLCVAGDSAGGGLTVATLLTLRDAGDPLPAAAVCLSPWLDLEGTGVSVKAHAARDPMLTEKGLHETARLYLAGANPRDGRASPIHADLAGLPPFLVHVGTAEIIMDDGTRFAERARAAGVDVTLEVWDDMIHVWHSFPMLAEARAAVEKVGAFIRARTGG